MLDLSSISFVSETQGLAIINTDSVDVFSATGFSTGRGGGSGLTPDPPPRLGLGFLSALVQLNPGS
jgi:hypothetical protein